MRGSVLWSISLVILVALVLSEIITVSLMERYVGLPRTEARVANFVGHLQTIRAALETMADDVEVEFIRKIDASEGVRVIHGDVPPAGLAIAPDDGNLRLFRQRVRDAFGPDMEIYARPEDAEAPRSLLWVRMAIAPDIYWIGVPRRHIDLFSTTATLLWSGAGIAIALLASFFIIRRLNRPLTQLAHAADSIGKLDQPQPVTEQGPDEIRTVTRAFNGMVERLRRIERERAAFLAGVSHDLRTPLSNARLELSMVDGRLEAETRRDILADLDDVNGILDNFIDFARTDAGEPVTPVDVSELAAECAEHYSRPDAAVTLDLAEVPLVELRPLALQRLVRNLLSNAFRHGGGEVMLRTRAEPDRVIIAVLDRGPGIERGEEERMKQPFVRKDDARGGSAGAGLGLAIADRIARIHGGTLDLLAREGGGLEARVSLPRSDRPPQDVTKT